MIYHYYVRYTIFNKKNEKLIGHGCTEIMINHTISTIEDINQIISWIKSQIKNGKKLSILIDFFTLLRAEAKDDKE